MTVAPLYKAELPRSSGQESKRQRRGTRRKRDLNEGEDGSRIEAKARDETRQNRKRGLDKGSVKPRDKGYIGTPMSQAQFDDMRTDEC